MPNDINELDETDFGLKQVFGTKFQDTTESAPVAEEVPAPSKDTCKETNVAVKPKSKPEEAEWHPVKVHTWKDDLKDATKSTVLYGGLNMLIFYWQQAGLMDDSIALPCMLVCAILCGLGFGKVLGRK